MRKARANNIAPASAESPKSGEVCLVSPLVGLTELMSGHEASKHVTQSTSEQAAPPGLTCPPRAGRARASSRTHTQTNRLIIGLTSLQSEVIASLSQQAEIAYILQQLDRVEALSKQLEQIHAPIAFFWQGLAAQRQGKGNLDHAEKLLVEAVSHAPLSYQARALFVLGSVAEYRGDYKAEAAFYSHALKLNTSDLFTTIETNRAIAISRAVEGDHKQAVEILERVLRLAHYYRARSPYLYLQTINSLAIELSYAGRKQEAIELARIACLSPLASIYHEFRETRAEIEQEIAETQSQANIVVVPARPAKQPQQKVSISFQIVGLYVRRRVIKPTIGRAPIICSIIERVATVAPIHAPPFSQ
ncbi:MAG: hypothetical protein WBV94_14810 [Blastocatellia bacterium]